MKSLSIFGSIVDGRFEANRSDLDFLVDFHQTSLDQYFELLDSLKKLFCYDRIDLVTVDSLKNKVIKSNILENHALLYAS